MIFLPPYKFSKLRFIHKARTINFTDFSVSFKDFITVCRIRQPVYGKEVTSILWLFSEVSFKLS